MAVKAIKLLSFVSSSNAGESIILREHLEEKID